MANPLFLELEGKSLNFYFSLKKAIAVKKSAE